MIIDALQVMLFGMLGIFFVMGVIIATISILKALSGRKKADASTAAGRDENGTNNS